MREIKFISHDNQKKMDELEDLINQGGADSREFMDSLISGEFRKPALSLVQFFRDLLHQTERAQLLRQIRKSGPSTIQPRTWTIRLCHDSDNGMC